MSSDQPTSLDINNKKIDRRHFLKSTLAAMGFLAALPTVNAVYPVAANPLIVWGWEGTFEGIQNQLSAFNQKYPDVTVEIQVFGYDDVHTKLIKALSDGSGAPDLCSIDVAFLAQYIDGLTDLSTQVNPYVDQFVSPTISLASYKGKFYGLATDSEPMGIYYRKDIWDQYGINEPDIATWNDLIAAGETLYEASQGKVYLYAMDASQSYFLYEVLALSQGFSGFYFSDDDTKVIVDSPPILEAVTVIKALWDGKGVSRNPPQLNQLLKSGKVASQIVGPAWFARVLADDLSDQAGKWQLMRVPAVKAGGLRVGYQYPTIFVIPQQSKLKEAAWELSRIGLTGPGARFLYDKTKILPAYRPLKDELKGKPDKFFGDQNVVDVWDSMMADTPKIFFGTGFREAQQIMATSLNAILNGQQTVEIGMKAAAEAMRAKLKKG